MAGVGILFLGATFCQFFFTYIDGTKYQGLGLLRVDKARKVLEVNKKFGGGESGRTQAHTVRSG